MTPFEDLLQHCTVKIAIPNGWGTGFFVAPGLILTCAHVVRNAVDSQVTVFYPAEQLSLSASVQEKADDGKTLDLALFELSEPLSDHPCVLLGEEPVEIGQALYSYGYLQTFEYAAPVLPVNEGLTGDSPPLLKLKGAQIEPGISGAALLDLRTNKVCGMVKRTRADNFDLGGEAIPTSVILKQFPKLRELQQAFHEKDRRWGYLLPSKALDAERFEPYLRSLIANERYQQKWGFYTPTDAVGKIQQPKVASELDIGLMVQLMQPKKTEDNCSDPPEKTEQLPVLEGVRKYAAEHVLLMGRPGSGKSTALLRLLVDEANQALADSSARIPVLVELRYLDADRPSVLERVEAFLGSHNLDLESAILKQVLTEGRLLLLVDGVNELPSEAARRAVARFRQDYPKTPMVFTTRDVALGGDLGIEKKLEMQPLSETQMRQFVQAYLPEQGEPMLRQLQGRLREVGQAPLLLWMLCQVFQGLAQIPSSLGLLFRWFTGEYDKLKQDVPVSDGLRHWQAELLQHLAFTMMQAEDPTELRVAISRQESETVLAEFLQDKVDYPLQRAKEWLEDLLEHHLIQPTSQNQLEFHHQLLQEYYAAEYLLKLLPNLTDDQLKRDYLNYLKWTEPVALLLAVIDEKAQALRVVKLAMGDEALMSGVDLMLGARLAGEVKPAFQATTVGWIDAFDLPLPLKIHCWVTSQSKQAIPGLLSALEHQDSAVRERAAEALGQLGSAEAIPGLLSTIKWDSAVRVCERAAEALGQLGSVEAIPGLLSALKSFDSAVRRSAAEALGQLGSADAIPGLLKDLEHPHPDIRRSAANALGRLGSAEAIPGLLRSLKDNDFEVWIIASVALGQLGSTEAIPGLLKDLEDQDPYVRWSAVEVLGNLGSAEAIPGLLRTLEDESDHVLWSVADALVKLGSAEAIPGLLIALEHPYSAVRRKAAEALGQLGSAEAIPGLLRVLEDQNFYVRRSATVALGRLGSAEAIPELLRVLEDQASDVRKQAIDALEELGSAEAIPGLLRVLEDQDLYVRRIAAEALGKLGSAEAISGLLRSLEDQDLYVRRSAANALGRIGSAEAIPKLLRSLEDQDLYVRRSAAEALGKLGSAEAIPKLLRVLEHPHPDVRRSAANALGRIGSAEAIPKLLRVLEDQESDVRRSATDALGQLGSAEAISGLLRVLEDQDLYVRRSTADAIAKIGTPELLTALWQQQFTSSETYIYSAISAIQNRCKYYNHDLWRLRMDRANS